MEACVIRSATPNDADALCVLHAESFGEGRWSLEQIRSSLRLHTTVARVACVEGKPCGFILCQLAGGEVEVLTFCVKPLFRRAGVGQTLLRSVLGEARGQNADRVFLEVAADNEAALSLYKAAGFKVIGTRPRYYIRAGGPVDAVMMALDL